jgi:hypothetical protein
MEITKRDFERMVASMFRSNRHKFVTLRCGITTETTKVVYPDAPRSGNDPSTLQEIIAGAKRDFGGFFCLRTPETGKYVPLYRRHQLPVYYRTASTVEVDKFIDRHDRSIKTGTLRGVSF